MLAAMLLSGCAQTQTDVPASEEENTELMYVEKVEMDDVELQDEVVALQPRPRFVHAGAGSIRNIGCPKQPGAD